MSTREIRIIGDPVLRKPATEVTELTGALARLADEMVETMYEAPGLGLAAPQVGVQKRFFVYDLGEGSGAIVNPTIRESDGEWLFEEGCLSVPGLSWEILRPKTIHIVGVDLNGKDVSIEADELEARLFQHELDHLDGILLVDLLDEDQARDARRALRELTLSGPPVVRSTSDGGLRLL